MHLPTVATLSSALAIAFLAGCSPAPLGQQQDEKASGPVSDQKSDQGSIKQTALPRLGHTPAEVEALCGPPTATPTLIYTFWSRLPHGMGGVLGLQPLLGFEPSEVKFAEYDLGDYNIRVAYAVGRAVSVHYIRARPPPVSATSGGLIPRKDIRHTPPISDDEIETLLAANSGGQEWTVKNVMAEMLGAMLGSDPALQEDGAEYVWTAKDRHAAWDGGLSFVAALFRQDRPTSP